MENQDLYQSTKTVKEIAIISKKSRRTIYNHIDILKEQIPDADIDQYIVNYNGTQRITEKGQAFLYRSLGLTNLAKKLEREKEKVSQEKKEKKITDKEILDFLKEQIKSKDEEIKAKNLQIEEKDNQIRELQNELRKQSEINLLHTQSMAIENYSKAGAEIVSQDNFNRDEDAPGKPGFFEWLKNKFK